MRTFISLRFVLALSLAAATAAMGGHSLLSAQARAADRERTLFVSAVDDKGEPVERLGPDAFIVREDAARREVLRVSQAIEPIDLALLVDNSTAAEDAISQMREAINKFVLAMPDDSRIAVIGLADRPTILVDYTSDRTRLKAGIARLFAMPRSGTTLLEGIVEATKGLRGRESTRPTILAITTDGADFSNRVGRDVVDTLTTAQVAFHAVTVGRFGDERSTEARERSIALADGPAATGGQRVALLSPHGIEPALLKIARELSSQYKVVYGRPQSLVPPRKVEVTTARPGVTMRGAPAREKQGA